MTSVFGTAKKLRKQQIFYKEPNQQRSEVKSEIALPGIRASVELTTSDEMVMARDKKPLSCVKVSWPACLPLFLG
ncbi:hypothetical protein J1N35_016266 [Gossypium stocksii]|uniref:Uncharacterized protein n=1 Tax=Gossypium stocksii TaxID=47602 RepID=A0A9D3VKA4_9ROSI|nr:hypothetical protein J1N35_016266 [Gossypium stocksii]